MNCTQAPPESLGAFLAKVRPGDACACCGATLQSTSGGSGSRTARILGASPGVRFANTALVCPACGCEISEETGPDAQEGRRELSPAA